MFKRLSTTAAPAPQYADMQKQVQAFASAFGAFVQANSSAMQPVEESLCTDIVTDLKRYLQLQAQKAKKPSN